MKSVSFPQDKVKPRYPSVTEVRQDHEKLLVSEIQKRIKVLKPLLFSDQEVEVHK